MCSLKYKVKNLRITMSEKNIFIQCYCVVCWRPASYFTAKIVFIITSCGVRRLSCRIDLKCRTWKWRTVKITLVKMEDKQMKDEVATDTVINVLPPFYYCISDFSLHCIIVSSGSSRRKLIVLRDTAQSQSGHGRVFSTTTEGTWSGFQFFGGLFLNVNF